MIKSQVISFTAKQLFASISKQPWAMLLESGSNTHENSRYDIAVAQPVASIESTLNINKVRIADQLTEQSGDPFTLIEALRKQLLDTQVKSSLPFVGGTVGLWSYDLGRLIETLPSYASNDLETPLMAVGIYDWALVTDKQENQNYLVVNSIDDRADQSLAARMAWIEHQLNNAKTNNEDKFKLTGPWLSNLTKAQYAQRFDKVQAYLYSGDCYQINLTQRFRAPYKGDVWHAYQALQLANKGPFSAYLNLPQSTIVSVSPERFVKLEAQSIEAKPIKGTSPRSCDPQKDELLKRKLEQSEKDRSENLMIVDLLRNDIGKVAVTGSVHVPQLFNIESFPAVHHLVTTIRAELKPQYSAEDLLRATFPGGSITGAPKVRAMQIIEELEPHRRSAYCGCVGYISANGNMDTNITIRTLIFENDAAYCWAGGGIVVDSELDAEYQECFDKLSKILPALENIR